MIKLIALCLLCAGAYFLYGYAATFQGSQSLAFTLAGHAVTWLTVTLACLGMAVLMVAKKVKG